MKKTMFFAAFCALILASGCTVMQSTYDKLNDEKNLCDDRVASLGRILSEERKDKERVKSELSATNDELAATKETFASKTRAYSALQDEKAKVQGILADTVKVVDSLNAQNAALTKELKDTKDSLEKQRKLMEAEGTKGDKLVESLKMENAETKKNAEAKIAALTQQKTALEAESTANAAKTREFESKIRESESKIAGLDAKIATLEDENKKLIEQKTLVEQEKAKTVDEMTQTYQGLLKNMEADLQKGNVTITKLKGQLTVKMMDAILFASGSDAVKKEGKKVLDTLATALAQTADQNIVIEGHTDNVPIGGDLALKFPTNWELSTARAVSVVRYLSEKAKIPPERISAAGFGEFKPISPNDTPEGREKNRRIEIKLVPIPKDLP